MYFSGTFDHGMNMVLNHPHLTSIRLNNTCCSGDTPVPGTSTGPGKSLCPEGEGLFSLWPWQFNGGQDGRKGKDGSRAS